MNSTYKKTLLFDGNVKNALHYQQKFIEKCNSYVGKNKNDSDSYRNKIICELYQTEIMYLLQLEILIKYFMEPIHKIGQLPLSMYQLMFGNIESLYGINRQLLEAINENPKEPAKAFSVLGPFFKLYSVYACGFKKSMEYLMRIEKEYKKVAELIHNQETRPEVGASLASLLIVPVQRVPRYRLILQTLLKHYSPSDPGLNIVQDALEKVSKSAEHMNMLVSECEEGEAMVKLARKLGSSGLDLVVPGRKIIKQGTLMQSSRDGKHGHSRYVVLLSDALMCCKGGGGSSGSLILLKFLPLKHLHVSAVLDSSTLIKVIYESHMFFLFTSDTQMGREWLAAIMDAKKQERESRQTLRKDKSKQKLVLRQNITARRIIQRAKRICLKKIKWEMRK